MSNAGPYIALGAIVAAIISGIFSFIQLIISKEQKISEFRQTWIDCLRDDVSNFVGYITCFESSFKTYKAEEGGKFSKDLRIDFIRSNIDTIQQMDSLNKRICLRLNPKEHEHILEKMDEINDLISDPEQIQKSELREEKTNVLYNEIQKTLKREWERVKRGEKTFRYTKNIIIYGIPAIIILVIIIYLFTH